MLPEPYHTRQFYTENDAQAATCLSMTVTGDTFMYALSDKEHTRITELCHLELAAGATDPNLIFEHIGLLINNYQLADRKFEQVNLAVLTGEFSMMPEAYAIEGSERLLLQLTSGGGPTRNAYKHHLHNINFSFSMERELVSSLERAFSNASIRHQGAVLIDLLFGHTSLVNQDILLNIGHSFIELAARRNSDLLFYNVFKFHNNEDVLYYLLFMMEQLGFQPATARLAIAGQLPATDELVKTIRKYIKQVKLCVSDPSVVLRGELLSLPQHYYFVLLNQHLCGL